ncbi:MinD/ParA family protein [Pseudomonas sp. MH9.2]|uniref:MinD/ParA family protein n=1 Tax=unclassified Pseudomonas TaxID=196821 RepID=UPI002AC8C792|nr:MULTISPECIES: MinD/ParA family protein [unclassified Pseudomonas]MEB0028805.1 MinD/ParA family protein [Pseudomonas sp. MH9.2]MEB0150085.1 MinD/ParA family protein [Pseudomonas sp. CCC2.2]MEE3509541.1 MinD/ParA family protein [Pseudomonas sp. 10C3]WPX68858.1 MinD/ParA family protein [Pseudomonas sp. MH9.2]
MNNMRPVQVIAVTSGKGGVGKTTVSINLSLALSKLGKRVVLLDADFGLSNIDCSLGLNPEVTLVDVVEGRCELRDILLRGPSGIRIIPAASGNQSMMNLTTTQHGGLIQAFSDLDDDIDVLVIDTASGIGDLVVNFVRAAREVLVVVCNEPASITNAYAFIRILNRDYSIVRFRILANMVRSQQEGINLFNTLTKMTDAYLDAALHYAGAVIYDECVVNALRRQRALSEISPRSKAALGFNALAQKVNRWPLESSPSGGVEFFIERLVDQSGVRALT